MSLSPIAVLQEAFQLAHRNLRAAVSELTPEQLTWRPQQGANSAAFYLWHIPRTTDLYINRRLLGEQELWYKENWQARISIEAEGQGTRGLGIGTGFTDQQVGAMPALASSEYLAYVAAIDQAVNTWLGGLTPEQLLEEREREGFPKTQVLRMALAALGHTHSHTGEIGYVKGLMGIRGRA